MPRWRAAGRCGAGGPELIAQTHWPPQSTPRRARRADVRCVCIPQGRSGLCPSTCARRFSWQRQFVWPLRLPSQHQQSCGLSCRGAAASLPAVFLLEAPASLPAVFDAASNAPLPAPTVARVALATDWGAEEPMTHGAAPSVGAIGSGVRCSGMRAGAMAQGRSRLRPYACTETRALLTTVAHACFDPLTSPVSGSA